eukprot:scaffold119192_cov20-Tisochrysis_lutea.AAC.1
MSSTPPQLSTEQIQKMLEDNYSYIKAIVDLHNLGRPEEVQQQPSAHSFQKAICTFVRIKIERASAFDNSSTETWNWVIEKAQKDQW